MSEIITRLLLNTKDFDANLSKSKKEISQFSQGVEAAGKELGSAFKGIAGAVGVAFGAVEVFDKIMKSSEANNDIWENSVRSITNVTNEFFSALTSGDFSTFYAGLDGIIQKAKDTAEALRQIEDAQTVFGYTTSMNRADFNEYMVTMKDPNASAADKVTAKAGAEGVIGRQREESQVLAEKALNAASALLTQRSLLSAGSISELDIEKTLRLALSSKSAKKIESLENEYAGYLIEAKNIRDKHTKLVTSHDGTQMAVAPTPYDQEYVKDMTALNNQHAGALLYQAMFNKTNGDDLKTLVSFLQQAQSARGEVASMEKTLLRAGSKIGAGSSAITAPAEGSIAFMEAKLKDLNKVLVNATTDDAREAARIAIKEVEQQISNMKVGVRKTLDIPEASVLAPSGVGKSKKDNGGLVMPSSSDLDGVRDSAGEMNKALEGSVLVTQTLASTMQSLTGSVDEGASAWLSYAANVVQSIASAIPAITAITAAKKAEANANAQGAAAKAGDAVAGIPIVGPVMAVAAVASVIAAIMAVPKFATGGVVPGSSYFGDKVLARVNSGEMILNPEQQARLLNAVDRSAENVHVTGDFRIQGKDLVCSVDNYNKYRRL